MTQPVETTAAPPQKEPPYPCPKGVNVADSVTLKLSPTNYFAWSQLMLAFLKSEELSGFVDGTINTPNKPSPLGESSVLGQGWKDEEEELKRRRNWDQQHMQQRDWGKGWEEHLSRWVGEQESREKWEQEHECQGREWEMEQARRVKWEREWKEENESQEEQKRREEWNEVWNKERKRQNDADGSIKYTGWKKSDGLVRGWILAMLTEEILLQVIDLVTARDVWIKLSKIFTPPFQLSHLQPIDWTDKDRGHIVRQYAELHKAALTNDWETAARFLLNKPDAMYQPITWCLETALIVAVRSDKRNNFVKQLMDKIKNDRPAREGIPGATALYAEVDISGATALHAAVDGGNKEAAEWLVAGNPELANIKDNYGILAVHVAAGLGHGKMVKKLLETTTLSKTENESGLKLLHSLASSGLYDIASTFLRNNGQLASMKPCPLVVISQKRTSFLSGINLNFLQRFIYSGIPLENIESQPQESDTGDQTGERDSANRAQESNIENQTEERDNTNQPQERDIENPTRSAVSALVYVKQKLKALFWIVAENFDPSRSIKSLRQIKLNHQHALNLVKCICKEVVKHGYENAAEIFKEPLRNATCVGIHEIVEEILDEFPSAIHLRSEKDQSLFQLAIVYRRANIFNLKYQMEEDRRAFWSMPDASTNNALHSAGNLARQQQLLLRTSAAGAALQMQRELQWFKEVENFILPQAKEHMNAEGKTPQEVFTETHEDLVKEGEQWMKDTATSCTIVAALITTIVFAAAIVVPGGSYVDTEKRGLPIRLGQRAFTVFGIFDALAMVSSSASLLMFLSILTSRYGEQDFLYSLPRRLIIGLVTLFFSIISMMVAFGATLKIVFGDKNSWILYPVAFSCCVPVTLFVLLQSPLLYAMVKSTYFPRLFGKQSHRILH